MFEADKWMLKQIRLKHWPPILIPIAVILGIFVFPIYYSIPIIKWLLGYWRCGHCKVVFGPKTERITEYDDYDTYHYECIHCQVAKKLEASK